MATDKELAEKVLWEEFRQALAVMTPRQRFGVRLHMTRGWAAQNPDDAKLARELAELEARALKLRQIETGRIPHDADYLGFMVGIKDLTGPILCEEFEALREPAP